MNLSFFQFLSAIGFLLSAYALHVKQQFTKNKNFKAACDISENISCTKAFSSGHGSLFLLPNSVWGILFYATVFITSFISIQIVFWLSLVATLGSVYLAYILYTKVKSFCLVCTSIYLINILLLIFSWSEIH